MSNSKIKTYEELKSRLSGLQYMQRIHKNLSKSSGRGIYVSKYKRMVVEGRVEINQILTSIHYIKQARKLYAELESYKNEAFPCIG